MNDRALLRELFLKRKPHYSVVDAMRLTRSGVADIDEAVARGFVSIAVGEGGSIFSWADVVTLALERWTPRMIDGALDHHRVGVIPLLNRIQHIDAFLPLYQIRLLHYLAETERGAFRARLNVSDMLERQLLGLASALDVDALDESIPGFRNALHYPYFIPREDDYSTAFCRFCGRVSGVPGREMCDDCIQRHEPKPHLGQHGIPELDEEES